MMRILVIDDEHSIRTMLKTILEKSGYTVDLAEDGAIGIERLRQELYDAVLCDVRMPGMDGFAVLDALREQGIPATVIVMTAFGTVDTAVEAMRRGAYDYLPKPFKADEVIITLRKVEERERLLRENQILRQQAVEDALDGIIVESPVMKEIMQTIEKVAPHRQTVLVTGESGAGKEIVARLLHEMSPRRQKPFVAINCSAIPEHLLESELFGYAKGAFTDATRPKRGLLEYADGGTCFLDEISEMREGLQSKLLRFLEDGEIRRVGDLKPLRVDVRIVAATNRELKQHIADGRFREDLFYRLNVIPLHIPPLRERPDDVEAYARREFGRAGVEVTPQAMAALREYRWPGNFRELRNFIERTLILGDRTRFDLAAFPADMRDRAADAVDAPAQEPDELSLKRAIERIERDYIARALTRCGGNRQKAADMLEISLRALHYKLKEYNLG